LPGKMLLKAHCQAKFSDPFQYILFYILQSKHSYITGLKQNFAWQGASTKLCLAKGLKQNIAWQWDFNKTLPGNGPSTKLCL
jgi:hypothetical protein